MGTRKECHISFPNMETFCMIWFSINTCNISMLRKMACTAKRLLIAEPLRPFIWPHTFIPFNYIWVEGLNKRFPFSVLNLAWPFKMDWKASHSSLVGITLNSSFYLYFSSWTPGFELWGSVTDWCWCTPSLKDKTTLMRCLSLSILPSRETNDSPA